MAMNYKPLLLTVSLNLVILVIIIITLPHLMISPGQPIPAHTEIANDCFECHTPFLGSKPEKCIKCHQVSEIGIKTTEGQFIGGERKNVAFHQELIEDDCVACHSDHNGVMAFRPISHFSHELVKGAMRERCQGCHTNPNDSLHSKIKENCSDCHVIEAWKPATLDHDKYFRFDRHHPADCESCHMDNNYNSYTCYGCHEHSRSNIRGEHHEEGIYNYENCVECHKSGDEDEAERLWRSRQGRSIYRSFEDDNHYEYEREYRGDHDDDD
jgi:hypothetical protein